MQANPQAPTGVLQTDSFDAGVDAPVDDGDKDVVAGFPVKRFVLMLVYANMICLGGAFVAIITLGIYSVVQFAFMSGYLTPGDGIVQSLIFFAEGFEQMWEFATDDPAQTARFLFLAIIPGTFGGIVWYLILRWRESVILRKRLRATKAKNHRPVTATA